MKVRRRTVTAFAVTISALVAVMALAGAGTASSQQTPLLAALVSDVGRFNDKSFNQSSSLAAAGEAGTKIKTLRCSRTRRDYIPNLTTPAARLGRGSSAAAS